ncbi:MAG: DMT family transporter [Clostridia bacterium]|nr:DMT family transporter [Clostridia bacterium]
METKNNIKGSLILIAAALIWGLAFVAQTSGAEVVPPFFLNSARSFIGALFLLTFLLLKDKRKGISIIPRNKEDKLLLLKGGIICGIFLSISVNFQQFGIAAYPDGVASEARSGFLTALYVILVPLFAIFKGNKISIKVLLGVIIAVIGIYMLCLTGGIDAIYLGDILVFICAICFTFHIMSVDKFVAKVDGVRLSMVQFIICGIISGILSLIFELDNLSVSNIISAILPILYLGIMSSGVAYTLQIVGQKFAEPTIASISMSLESVFAALGGWLISGNTLSVRELIGCALVFIAIIVAQLPTKQKV